MADIGSTLSKYTSASELSNLLESDKFGIISVKSFGATGDGVADDRHAFINAVEYAESNGSSGIFIPNGTYYMLAVSDGAINIPSNLMVFGEGEGSVITFDDNPATSLTYSSILFRAIGKSNITLTNFKINGSLNTYPTSMQTNALPLVQFDDCENTLIDNVHLEGCRTISTQISDCKKVKIINSSVLNSIRDGFRCVNCSDVTIDNNSFFNVADDCITVSSVNSVTDHVNSDTIITNNIITMSQGIKALGGKNINISNNIFKLCHQTAISVDYITTGDEGKSPLFNLTINNNIIQDHLRFQAYSEGALIVDIIGMVKTVDPDDGNKIPSFTKDAYDFNWVKSPSVLPAFENINFTNNKIIRTRPNATNFSDYGYGTIIIRDSTTPYNDPQITDAMFATYGVQFKNCINNAIISDNIFSGYNTFNSLVFSSDYTGISFEHIYIKNNIFKDNGGITPLKLVMPLVKNNFIIEGNTFDVDPYFRNTYHNADNTWNASGVDGTAIAGADLKGVTIRNNSFLNCFKAFANTHSVNLNNYGFGIDTGNPATCKGIYDFTGITAITIDGDPTSATFRQAV